MAKTNKMSKSIIILGAGASRDYSAYVKKHSLLTNDLVKPEFLDTNVLSNNFKDATDLLSVMSDSILSGKKGFEERLMDIKNEAEGLPNIKSQLVSLEFYLQKVFSGISENTEHPINNYKILIQKINYHNRGQAHIVSFNYDTLFEFSVGIDLWQTVESYIKNDLKLIKVHGSHDWIYIQNRSLVSAFDADLSDYDFYIKYPDYLDNIRSNQRDISPYTKVYI